MYFKLALRNVKRQMENYLIYFLTVSLTVALLFAINNIIYSSNLTVFVDRGESARTALRIMVVMISMVVAFVLSFSTSFLLKCRKREFGTYLTLGMTRKNLLTIFLAETLVICSIALGAGLAAGIFFFQGLMAVMMKLLEMEFSIASCSAEGLFRTVLLIVGIFLLASTASAIYLKRVSIYDLIHGEKKVEKGVRHPVCWFFCDSGVIFCADSLRHSVLDRNGYSTAGRQRRKHGISAGRLYSVCTVLSHGNCQKYCLSPAAQTEVVQPRLQYLCAAPALRQPECQFCDVRMSGAADEPGRGGDEFFFHPESQPGGNPDYVLSL